MAREYALFCIILGDNQSFRVKIIESALVEDLKEGIKKRRSNRLRNLNARDLILYHVEFPDDYNLIKSLKVSNLDGLPPLSSSMQLTTIFNAVPKEDTVHIIIQLPLHVQEPSYLQIPKTLPSGQHHDKLSRIKQSLNHFHHLLRPIIKEFISKPLKLWDPPSSMDAATRRFYQQLEIPLVNHRPNLLLHGIATRPDNAEIASIFSDRNTIFCNTSGSGKTRRLFEGLCQNWGFYFVPASDGDGIGTQDLQVMIELMSSSPGWAHNVFEGQEKGIPLAESVTNNEMIAQLQIAKVVTARWLIFREFIEIIKSENNGRIPEDAKYKWLLFQVILPEFGAYDPFKRLVVSPFNGIDLPDLLALNDNILWEDIIGTSEPFFYVLDHAQAAGEKWRYAFCDSTEEYPRPVLCPIVQYLVSSSSEKIKVILSGTGFSLEPFRSIQPSGMNESEYGWKIEHGKGVLDDPTAQSAYMRQYLPARFLLEQSGELLLQRSYSELRGRPRFSTSFLEALLEKEWDGYRPKSPHKLLTQYILAYGGVSLSDVNPGILAAEQDVPRLYIGSFPWAKVEQAPHLKSELLAACSKYVSTGEHPRWPNQWDEIVEFGIGRFESDKQSVVIIDEPIALASLLHWFDHDGCRIRAFVKKVPYYGVVG